VGKERLQSAQALSGLTFPRHYRLRCWAKLSRSGKVLEQPWKAILSSSESPSDLKMTCSGLSIYSSATDEHQDRF